MLLLTWSYSFRKDFVLPKELCKVFVQFELHKYSQKLQKRRQLKNCVQTTERVYWGLSRVMHESNSDGDDKIND